MAEQEQPKEPGKPEEAGEAAEKTDESVIRDVLNSVSTQDEMDVIMKQYNERTGRSLRDDLQSEWFKRSTNESKNYSYSAFSSNG
jgi:DNA-binding transcriptional regulator YbjK